MRERGRLRVRCRLPDGGLERIQLNIQRRRVAGLYDHLRTERVPKLHQFRNKFPSVRSHGRSVSREFRLA